MKNEHVNEIYREQVEAVLKIKTEEFAFLGFDSISQCDLWEYLTDFKWMKVKEAMSLNTVVADIYSAKVGDYMSYASFKALKTGVVNNGDEIDLGDLSDLF